MESLSPYDNHFIDDKVPAFYLPSQCIAASEKKAFFFRGVRRINGIC